MNFYSDLICFKLELLTERNSVKQFLDYAMEDYEKEKIDLANDGAGELLKFSGEDMRSIKRIQTIIFK